MSGATFAGAAHGVAVSFDWAAAVLGRDARFERRLRYVQIAQDVMQIMMAMRRGQL